ncbi:helix-turn-helix transcriptional regulator [Vagococcus salmoninarum]|uniref:Transcriptional regulator n=1 Tax=Vagococcus salmoninarum TaxID=2739 RepID=A0A429ZVN7_9ENTE|nr:transcriptional regulator [Vagococcus salmoninarum]RST97735.1 hypothetical protein CBF35_00140 [Vagococcus salmoninarum]
MNIIAGYRRMLGYTQNDIAQLLKISKQSYWLKENGRVAFSDKEKVIFRNLLVSIFPDISIDEIFFAHLQRNTKKNDLGG